MEEFKNIEFVGFLGKIGSGKSYKTSKLKEQGFTEISLADSLRDICKLFYGPINNPINLNYEEWKRTPTFRNSRNRVFAPTGRELLQKVGSYIRSVDPSFFVKATELKIKSLLEQGNTKFVCSDIRFLNEAEFFHRIFWKDCTFIVSNYISNRYDKNNSHESEKLASLIIKSGYDDNDIITLGEIKRLK